jgi:hypothetical protein
VQGPPSIRVVKQPAAITSTRQAAAVCNVSPPVVRRWLSLGLIPKPPWTRVQREEVRNLTDPGGRRRCGGVLMKCLDPRASACQHRTFTAMADLRTHQDGQEPGELEQLSPRSQRRKFSLRVTCLVDRHARGRDLSKSDQGVAKLRPLMRLIVPYFRVLFIRSGPSRCRTHLAPPQQAVRCKSLRALSARMAA